MGIWFRDKKNEIPTQRNLVIYHKALNSIQGRLSLSIGITVLVIFVAMYSYLFRNIAGTLESNLDGVIENKANSLQTLVKFVPNTGMDFDFADEVMPEFESLESLEYFQLWQTNGELFESSRSLKNKNLHRLNTLPGQKKFTNLVLPDGRLGRMIEFTFYPRTESENDDGNKIINDHTALTLVYAREREKTAKIIQSIGSTIFASLAIVFIALLAYIVFWVRKGLAPLNNIGKQLETIDANELSYRIENSEHSSDLTPIIDKINELLVRIEKSFFRVKKC